MKNKIEVGRLGVDNSEKVESSSDGVLRILSVSSLVPVRRVHLIPLSLQLVEREVIWTHIGGGNCQHEVENEMIHLNDNVKVNLLGQLSHDDVLNYYSNTCSDND